MREIAYWVSEKEVLSSVNEMVWQIKTKENDHVVGYKAGIDSGEVLLDGNVVKSKGSSTMGVLMKMSFKIDGKPARVQRRSLLSEAWELVYEGKVYVPSEQANIAIM